MSDNEDLLGDDLGDHSLADYNLGNDEEDQLLADDYDSGSTQNVPSSIESFREPVDMVPSDYSGHGMDYGPQPIPYQPIVETECVVPNIVVEVPNLPPAHSTYAPYEPRHYEPEHSVPSAMPTEPIEPPQIVPSEIVATIPNDMARERFISERPVGAQRMPQVRDIPDSLDKVVISGGFGAARGRTSWRNPQFNARFPHPYRRNNMQRGNFSQRNSFPPPQQQHRPLPPHSQMPPMLLENPPLQQPPMPQIRVDISQNRPMEMSRPPFHPDRPMDMPRPQMNMPRPHMDMQRSQMDMPRPHMDMQRSQMDMPRPQMNMPRPHIDMQRPPMDMPRPHMEMQRPQMDMARPHMDMPRPHMDMPRPHMDMPRPHMDMQRSPGEMQRPGMEMQRPPFQQFQRFPIREERPMFNQMRPQFERPPFYPRQQFQRFGPPMPQVTIRQNLDKKEPEVRMLPVPLPANLSGGLAGKKVLINPHFKGNIQPVEGPIKDIDDAAERFIAEQRNALARAAQRKFPARSPPRYIEDTTIQITNELARRPPRRRSDDDLLRRQEEFIHANRAGLRRRMRSPSPPLLRRSPSPSPSPTPCPAPAPRREPERDRRHQRVNNEEDSEYKRRVREQESMRERVLRAKEVRRRKNAAIYLKQMQDREREEKEKDLPKERTKPSIDKPIVQKPVEKADKTIVKPSSEEETKPDTTRKTPERDWTPELEIAKEKTPVKIDDEVNSTCEDLTPPAPPRAATVETPPLASDDELDLILGDIDGILSDDDDIITTKEDKPKPKADPPKPKPLTDLRSKLPPKSAETKKQRQKIIFTEEREDKKKKEKSPPRKAIVSSTKVDDTDVSEKKSTKQAKQKQDLASNKSRPRIIFENKDLAKQSEKEKKPKPEKEKAPAQSNRRVILQRKPTKESKSVFSRIEVTNDPSKPNPGIFSRAVRTIAERESNRIVVRNEPQVEYDSSSDDEDVLNEVVGNVALVDNLPHGMTDTRLKTLAGDVQSLMLDKEERSAKITFKTSSAAETFRKKFNNKMVAASRLSVTLQ